MQTFRSSSAAPCLTTTSMNSRRRALPQYSRQEPPLKTSSKRFSRFSTVPRWANVPLDPDVAELVQALAETGAPALSEGTVEQARSNYFRTPTPPPDEIAHVVDSLVDGPHGSIPIRIYATTAQPADLPVVVMFRGEVGCSLALTAMTTSRQARSGHRRSHRFS